MSVAVVTVGPATPIREVARLLVLHRVGGLPVIEEGRLVGIVTSTDLLPSEETDHPARTVADVMTRDPITATEDASIAAAARLLSRHGIKRAPVCRNGVLVGIVTRSDLLRPYLRTDSEIRAEIEEGVLVRLLNVRPRDIRVSVHEGVVAIEGEVADHHERAVLIKLVRDVDGVVDVEESIAVADNGPTRALLRKD